MKKQKLLKISGGYIFFGNLKFFLKIIFENSSVKFLKHRNKSEHTVIEFYTKFKAGLMENGAL